MYSIIFTKVNTKFCLSLHDNGANSYLFVNGTEIYKFTTKDPMIFPNNLCLENVSKDFSASNMKTTRFNGYIYDFSVDYNSIDVNHIKDIHKYLMKKQRNSIKSIQICEAMIMMWWLRLLWWLWFTFVKQQFIELKNGRSQRN